MAVIEKNTIVGTLTSNRTGMSKEVKDKQAEDLSTIVYWGDESDTVLSSNVVKTNSRGKMFCY